MSSSYPSAAGHTTRGTLGPISAGSLPSAAHVRPYLILVIDDSLAVRRVVEFAFAREGMDAISFPDGVTAINALASGDIPVPDLVLLDIGLPGMDGYAVARILHSNAGFQETPIIMLTGRDGVWDRVRAKLAGARDFVAKPFRCHDLVERVRGYLPHDAMDGGTL